MCAHLYFPFRVVCFLTLVLLPSHVALYLLMVHDSDFFPEDSSIFFVTKGFFCVQVALAEQLGNMVVVCRERLFFSRVGRQRRHSQAQGGCTRIAITIHQQRKPRRMDKTVPFVYINVPHFSKKKKKRQKFNILESLTPSVHLSVCSSVRVSDCVCSISPEPLDHFF